MSYDLYGDPPVKRSELAHLELVLEELADEVQAISRHLITLVALLQGKD